MRKIAVVPTLLTLGNGVCGFVAIAIASKIVIPDPGQVIAAEMEKRTEEVFRKI